MADRKWSELDPAPDVRDGDEVALRRGTGNFRWSFVQFRTWLESYFEALGSVGSHNADVNAHTDIRSDVSNNTALIGSLDTNKADKSIDIATSGSLTGGGDLSASRTLQLDGDSASPPAGQYYGTDGAGTKGFYPLATAGEANTTSNEGGGIELALAKSGVNLPFRTLNNDDGTISYVQTATGVTIRASLAAGAGTIRRVRYNSGGANVSDGRSRLNFIDGTGLSWSITDNAGGDETNIVANVTSAGGENNTSSNVGGGAESALPKSGFDLPFRTFLGDSMVGVTQASNTIDFNLNDSSITAAKLVDSYTLAADFSAHVGSGGPEHQTATTSVAGFMSGSDKTKLDGISAGAEVNAVNSVYGRTGNVVAASGDYNATQVTNALGTNKSSTMDSDRGVAFTVKPVASGGTFVPNPLQGQAISLTGSADTEIGDMQQTGSVLVEVPLAITNVTFNAAWTVAGTRSAVAATMGLSLTRVGSRRKAEWF